MRAKRTGGKCSKKMFPYVASALVFGDRFYNVGLNGHEDPRLATLEEPFFCGKNPRENGKLPPAIKKEE